MASVVDIYNLALANIGDSATVIDSSPPDASTQAELCARFYPIARDALLEMHTWGFATKRVALALLSSGWPEWDYCYAMPSDAVNVLAVLPPDATDDYSQPGVPSTGLMFPNGQGSYVPQPFSCESLADGTEVIYTDQEGAVLRYTCNGVAPTSFSPTFTTALSWQLSSMLAGPIIKGVEGMKVAQSCLQTAQYWIGKAIASDANQRKIDPVHNVPWMAGR